MTTIHRLAIGAAVLSSAGLGCNMRGIGWHAGSRTIWSEEIVETRLLDVPGLRRVDVRTHNGRVAYAGSPRNSELIVTITKKGGGTNATAAEAALAAIDVFAEPQPNGVAKLGWRWRGQKSRRWSGRVSFEIEGPASIDLDGTTHNGAIAVRGVEGDTAVETHNGAVAVDSRSGRLAAKTHNGRISVTYDGDHVNLRTHNGVLEADLSRCGAVGGSITTHNGGVRLAVGNSTSADLACRTYNGGISVEAPLSSQTYTRRRLVGTLGDGGRKLAVATHNGSIRILKAEG